MFLKKILAVAAAVVLLTGCCCKKSYNIAFLGDIHYDSNDLHNFEIYKQFNPKVPFAQGVLNKDGLYSWRSQTLWAIESLGHDTAAIPKNVKMWKEDTPKLLDNAAKTAKKYNTRYLFQLGDIIQGDAGRYDLHKKMLQGGFDALTSRFDCPVLVNLGNHDLRGPGGMQSWKEIIEASYDRNVKAAERKNSCFYFMLEKDIYFFYDLLNPDLDMLEKAVNTPSRYFFFISHVPVIPAEAGKMKNIVTDDTEKLTSLLLKRNAIVLSGHTHGVALYRYTKEENSITQFIINSTLRDPVRQKNFKKEVAFNNKKADSKAQNDLWNKLFAGKINVELLTDGSGFGILRVSDDGVYVDYYNVDCPKITFTLKSSARDID